MVRFYDPKNNEDLERVQALLAGRGIEHFLVRESEPAIGSMQILVAEEDLPAAEELLKKECARQPRPSGS